jgi:hypothetical protein
MNPILLSLIPLAVVIAVTPFARGAMNTVLIGVREKRWVTPFVPYARKNTSPIVAATFALSMVLAVIVPLMPLIAAPMSFAEEGNVMTVVGLLAVTAIMVSIYHPHTRLTAVFGCMALALIAGCFAANTSDLGATVLAHQLPSSTLPVSIGFIGALLLATGALFDPANETSSNLGDSIVVQRTVWSLFLANLLIPFVAPASLSSSQGIGLVILVSIVKVLVVAVVIEAFWMLRSRFSWLTTTMLLRGSVVLSIVTFVLAISSIAS